MKKLAKCLGAACTSTRSDQRFYCFLSYLFVDQGSYRQTHVKFKDFSKTSKRLSYCFQGLEIYEKNWFTRDVFYVRREVDLMKTAKVNAYIIHIFGKIEQPKII